MERKRRECLLIILKRLSHFERKLFQCYSFSLEKLDLLHKMEIFWKYCKKIWENPFAWKYSENKTSILWSSFSRVCLEPLYGTPSRCKLLCGMGITIFLEISNFLTNFVIVILSYYSLPAQKIFSKLNLVPRALRVRSYRPGDDVRSCN